MSAKGNPRPENTDTAHHTTEFESYGVEASAEIAADWLDLNRSNWDQRVPIHLSSDFYSRDGFKETRDVIREFEKPEVGDVTGKSVLHLQCHTGQDTLSWAYRGAKRVVGLDFSPNAVDAANDLAKELDYTTEQAQFVTSDVYKAHEVLGDEKFDMVYTGIGALCWLPDIKEWAKTVASFVAEGGFFYIAEFHPITWTLFPSGQGIHRDYFYDKAMVEDFDGTYTDGDGRIDQTTTVEFQHTLGDIVSALAAQGLRIEFLHEHDFTLFEATDNLVFDEKRGYFVPKDGDHSMPLMFSLKASRS